MGQRERQRTCPNCGLTSTSAGPFTRHKNRCPATNEELAVMVGAKHDDAQACWIPTVTAPSGRAKVRGGRRAHVVACEIAEGRPVPDGHVVLHSCDVMNCVNPAHLRFGTQAENVRDMMAKGRNRGRNQ